MDSYDRPTVLIPKVWPHVPDSTTDIATNVSEIAWWTQYHSDELNELILKALKQNNNLQIAIAKTQYAQSQLNSVKLNWLPGLSLLAGQSQFPIFGNPGAFFIAAPLYIVNIIQQYKEQKGAEAIKQASMDAKDCVKLLIIAEVSASFFTLISQQDTLNLYKKLLHDYQTQLHLAQTKYRSGLISPDDIDQIKAQIKETRSQIAITQHNINVVKNTLHFLLNEDPGELIIKTSFKDLNTNQLIPGDLPLTVLNNRPDIREADALLRAAHHNVGATAANLLPSITLGAYLGKGSTINGRTINATEFYVDTPIINLPVFAQISASKAQQKAAGLNYINTVRGALRDVDNDLSAYTAFTDQYNTNLSAYQNKKQQCHWVELRFKNGINDNTDIVKCHITLHQFELVLNQNKLEKMKVIIKLYQDLGGGYHGV